jgi:uncharacterized protein YjbJ (UPF0337 family)
MSRRHGKRHTAGMQYGWRIKMNKDTLKGQWTQLKGTVREQWGKLTNDDIDQIQGQSEQLVGKVTS